MPVPIICLTNGRPDCIAKTIPSANAHLTGVSSMVIVDDSGDDVYGQWLEDEYVGGPWHTRVLHLPAPHGYWRAMQAVWALARHWDKPAFAFWEDDFVLTEDVDLDELAEVLDARRDLMQMALLRQPWFTNEVEHGGLIEALEAQGQRFTECTNGRQWWIEHRAVFTGNPCLIPRRTLEHDWPEGDWSESRFSRHLFQNPHARAAYWGRRTDPPRVEHIGHARVGSGY
ncbi:glycosyltransferase family 2 protein [Actinomadura viridis]|uniref:glycosyltransferase family 2 protein n=1 Tax=Actinomadura viridis TaxID=58110 RepID=UPI003686FDD2